MNAKAYRDSRNGSTSARAPFAVSSSNARSTSVTRNARWSSSSPLRYGVWNLEPGGYQLGRSRALQLDPDAAVAHRPPSRDLHAHDLPVEPDRGFEISDSNSRIEEFHHARVTEPSVFTLRGTCATRVGSPSEA